MNDENKTSAEKLPMKQVIENSVTDADIFSGDIPTIDLYVDQIISLLSDKITQGEKPYDSRLLTKTMINNYSKDGLILPTKGKKYTKEQIIQILMIYSLKSTLSMADISRILSIIYADEDYSAELLSRCYDNYVRSKEACRKQATEIATAQLGLKEDGTREGGRTMFLNSCLYMLALSDYLKNIAQQLFYNEYPAPKDKDKEKEKEKEKDKEKPKAKANK